MAIRRAKQKSRSSRSCRRRVRPPGETFIACVHCETGPSPWLNALFDEVPLLGVIVAYTRKFYFLTLTNTSIVVNSASRYTNRPGEIVFAFPQRVPRSSALNRATVWSSMHVQFPGGSKPTRLNIHRYWRNEFDQLLAALAAGARRRPGAEPGPRLARPHRRRSSSSADARVIPSAGSAWRDVPTYPVTSRCCADHSPPRPPWRWHRRLG